MHLRLGGKTSRDSRNYNVAILMQFCCCHVAVAAQLLSCMSRSAPLISLFWCNEMVYLFCVWGLFHSMKFIHSTAHSATISFFLRVSQISDPLMILDSPK